MITPTISLQDNDPSNDNKIPDSPVIIKPYCKKQLCKLYGISYKILAMWLDTIKEDVGPCHGIYYNINQVKTIFIKFGIPNRRQQD